MRLFSRILVILICLALAACAIAVAVLAWTIPEATLDWLANAIEWMRDHDTDTEKALLTAAAISFALVALSSFASQVLPKSSSDVKVTDLKAGNAVLSTAAVGQRIDEAVRRVPHIAHAKTSVKAKRKGVLVSLDLYVDPNSNLATVTDDACEAVLDVLANQVHIALVQPPQMRLHYRELRLRARPVAPDPAVSGHSAAKISEAAEKSATDATPAPAAGPVPTGQLSQSRQGLIRQATDPSLGAPIGIRTDRAVAVAEPESGPEGRPPE